MTEGIANPYDKERPEDRSPVTALLAISDRLHREPSQSSEALARLLPKLGRHLETVRGIADLRNATEADIRIWVEAPLPGGVSPSLATRHNRRAAARLAFRLLRDQGVVAHDPTVDLSLPHRLKGKVARPLTNAEITVGRAASAIRLSETFRSAAWALAEATATTHEIPRVLVRDVDLSAGVVWLGGSAKVEARLAPLTDWGVDVLGRRLDQIDGQDSPVAYLGSGVSEASMQASAATALSRTLRAARLSIEPTVKPASIRAWAGLRVFDETGRVDDVARALGCKTLDTAAEIIGYDWRADR